MPLNLPTTILVVLVLIGCVLPTPVLFKGFSRRGTGIKYENNFLIQRAPQLMSGFTVFLIAISGLTYNGYIPGMQSLVPFVVLQTGAEPQGLALYVSWLGILVFLSGMVFMIGGWISLGEFFSTDAEIMENHSVKDTGLLSFVMHPAYSGIIQCLIGAALACTSIFCALFAIMIVAPLWLRRAKYEETILIEALGEPYKTYGENMGWRRLVPRFIPIGV